MHEPSFILYTSGTTGRAKGVLLTVHGMLWVAARLLGTDHRPGERDTVLSPLPLFHSYALNLSVLAILATGASEYIMEQFSTSRGGAPAQDRRIHLLPRRADHVSLPAAGDEGRKDLRSPACGCAFQPARSCRQRSIANSRRTSACRCSTATASPKPPTMVTMNWPTRRARARLLRPAAAGPRRAYRRSGERARMSQAGPGRRTDRARAERDARLSQQAGGDRDGTAQRLVSHRRSRQGATRTASSPSPGRLKELIIRGGQNIAPAEIEEVVNTFEPVLDCAVVGAPHEHLGEVPALFVVPRAGQNGRKRGAACSYCRSASFRLQGAACAVHLIAEIPRTGSGKIIRYKLKERSRREGRASSEGDI